MSDTKLPIGQIGWVDLTVADADSVRDFYQQVTGWTPSSVNMGDYSDYCMTPPGGAQPVSGICHARGGNAGLPPVWLIYITVADLDGSVSRCLSLGGKVRKSTESMGSHGRFCILEDPAGAVFGLFESAKA
jgi:predicted enzyme related to lactoylglutathione lyase